MILYGHPGIMADYEGNAQTVVSDTAILWMSGVRGIIIFEKMPGSDTYTPILTEDGNAMVTDIFDTTGTSITFSK